MSWSLLVKYAHKFPSFGRSCTYRYDTSTGKETPLIEFDKSIEKTKVSKNGRWLSYVHKEGVDCSLSVVDLFSKKERTLARWKQNVPTFFFGNYAFTRDSKEIVIGYGGKIHLIELETGEDKVVPFTANVNVDMGALNKGSFKVSQNPLQVKYMRDAQTSPDGRHLIFSALNRIYIMDLPNGNPHVLINQPFIQVQPSWSADSKWIAFVSWSDQGFGQVWKIGRDGKQLKQITHEAGVYHNPCWSPDGTSIAVSKSDYLWQGKPALSFRDGPGKGKLYLIKLNSGVVKMIADSVQLSTRAMFSEDGEMLIYMPDASSYPGNYRTGEYLVAKNNKTENKALAMATAHHVFLNEFFLRQIAISPDGKYIVYVNEENLHLVPVAPTGNPPFLYDRSQRLPVIRFARGGFDPHWQKGGKLLSWSFANQYFEIDPERIISAARDLVEKNGKIDSPISRIIDVDVTPDKTIAIDLKISQKIGRGILALKNVRIITMKNSQVIEKGTVLIKDGRFVSIGKMEDIKIPTESKIIDLAGKTIMPGLIDLHDHVSLPAEIFPQQKWDLLAGLAYGTTTAREPSGSHDSFGYEELIATGGMIGPRLFNVGHAVRETTYPDINDLNEARIIVQNRIKMGALVVKQYRQGTRLKRQLLLMACKEAGVNMTNEVEKGMYWFLGHLKDGTSGIEHNPLWGEAYNDVIQLMAKSGTYLTPTLQVAYGTTQAKDEFLDRFSKIDSKLARFYPEKEIVSRNIQKLTVSTNKASFINQSAIDARVRHAGGRIAMGSHGEDPGLGAHFEIWALQMGGLTNMEAIQAATIMAAGALGMQQDLGSIEPGKIADLIILNKNPLDNIRNTIEIQSVMKDGVLYDGSTLDEIWPKAKKFQMIKN